MRQQTVVGMYSSEQNAQNAINELRSAGFSRGRIAINHQAEQSKYRIDDSGRLVRSENYVPSSRDTSSMGEFFRALVGRSDEKKHAQAYSQAVSQGYIVLQVTCDSDEQAEYASNVMEHYDPIDIDDYAFSVNNPAAGTGDAPSYMQRGGISSDERGTASMGRQDMGRQGMEQQGQQANWQSQQGMPQQRPQGSWQGQQDISQQNQQRMDWQGQQSMMGQSAGGTGTWDDQAYDDVQTGKPMNMRPPHETMFPNARPSSQGRQASDWQRQQGQQTSWQGQQDAAWQRQQGMAGQEAGAISGQTHDDIQKGRPMGMRPSQESRYPNAQPSAPEMSRQGMGQQGQQANWQGRQGGWQGGTRQKRRTRSYYQDQPFLGREDMAGGRPDLQRTGRPASYTGEAAYGGPSQQSPESRPVQGGGAHMPDESQVRHHHWTSGGRDDDYASSAQFGSDYADNDTNPNHRWEDIEWRLRSDWATYNPDPGSWERNREAIRYGWEKGRYRGRDTHSGESLR